MAIQLRPVAIFRRGVDRQQPNPVRQIHISLLRRPVATTPLRRVEYKHLQWRQLHQQRPSALLQTRLGPRPPFAFRPTRPSARAASTAAADARSLVTRLKNLVFGTAILLGLGFFYYYGTDTRSGIHRWLVVPIFQVLYDDAEDAHHAGNRILKQLYSFKLHPRERGNTDKALGDLSVEVFGHVLDNPIGTSAGIDKDADIPDPLFALGSAIVEVGGVTPQPQHGNEKPRVFRITSQDALINRYGLNSEGAEHVAMMLRQRLRKWAASQGHGTGSAAEQLVLDGEAGVPPGSQMPGRLLAVQIAKNKTTPDNDIAAVTADYVFCAQHLAHYADILVVNVSSPNTPGLRGLQRAEPLTEILTGVVAAARASASQRKSPPPAVMVKVSPDEDSAEQVRGVCRAVWASGVDGVIVGNTTKMRPDPFPEGYVLSKREAAVMLEQGGYSGPQLFERTVTLVKKYRQTLDEGLRTHAKDDPGPKVIFASGGITNGSQALRVLNAGAQVAQCYTALVYGGVGTISRMKREMRDEMAKGR